MHDGGLCLQWLLAPDCRLHISTNDERPTPSISIDPSMGRDGEMGRWPDGSLEDCQRIQATYPPTASDRRPTCAICTICTPYMTNQTADGQDGYHWRCLHNAKRPVPSFKSQTLGPKDKLDGLAHTPTDIVPLRRSGWVIPAHPGRSEWEQTTGPTATLLERDGVRWSKPSMARLCQWCK